MAIELKAPLFVSWQLTRDCNLACVHCCTDSAPGKALPGELTREQALAFADQIVDMGVPYAMICGGEPLMIPHFMEVAERLGRGGVSLKIETNGHLLTPDMAARLAKLPIRSIQISLDGDTEQVYARQRIGGNLEAAWAGCKAAKDAGLPLEITFAPTRRNIHEASAVLDRAILQGAFRFNTGALMRIGTAAKLWDQVVPTEEEYVKFRAMLDNRAREVAKSIELCYLPFTIEEGLAESLAQPPAVLQVLPDGRVKVAAPLPLICADVRVQTLAQAWESYLHAWTTEETRQAAKAVIEEPSQLAESNRWRSLREAILT